AAGLITQDAFKAAADPKMFPEAGAPPWQVLKLYMGGVRENEDWTLRTDTGEYSPLLGDSYQNFSRVGLSYQRSQNGGRLLTQPGPSYAYYKRLAAAAGGDGAELRLRPRERSFFDGIDTTLPGLFKAIRRPAPAGAAASLASIDTEIKAAISAFSLKDPSAAVPALTRGLAATRRAIAQFTSEPDAVFILDVK